LKTQSRRWYDAPPRPVGSRKAKFGILMDGLGLALFALGFFRLLAPSAMQTFFIA
jgi:hypothetical protein